MIPGSRALLTLFQKTSPKITPRGVLMAPGWPPCKGLSAPRRGYQALHRGRAAFHSRHYRKYAAWPTKACASA